MNYLEFPKELTGVDARVIALVGKWFPTGAHKVGAAFGCLAPRLVTGQFDPSSQKAVWPSTGNYCRGGAYDSQLFACDSIAILPEGMSRERFEWLESVAGEIIRTPGTEANVKEIFDKCWELRESGEDLVIFNQFDEFGKLSVALRRDGPCHRGGARGGRRHLPRPRVRNWFRRHHCGGRPLEAMGTDQQDRCGRSTSGAYPHLRRVWGSQDRGYWRQARSLDP